MFANLFKFSSPAATGSDDTASAESTRPIKGTIDDGQKNDDENRRSTGSNGAVFHEIDAVHKHGANNGENKEGGSAADMPVGRGSRSSKVITPTIAANDINDDGGERVNVGNDDDKNG